eukprot:2912278-Pyramimonas_sp.AAC.1
MQWLRAEGKTSEPQVAQQASALRMLSGYSEVWDGLDWAGEDGVTVNSLGDFLQGLRDPDKRAQVCKCLQDQVLSHTAADAVAAKQSWKEYSELAFSNGASLAH